MERHHEDKQAGAEGSGQRKVAIIGAGPVGSLAALRFAKLGWHVTLYDRRGDPRHQTSRPETKSINLALSERGVDAIRQVSKRLIQKVLANIVPMEGRMIHSIDGKQELQKYDVHGHYINSIDRWWLNSLLVQECNDNPLIELEFHSRLIAMDTKSCTMSFTRDEKEFKAKSDLIVGADGAYSQVRYHLMRSQPMDFSQMYIDCVWCEISFPSGPAASYRMNKNSLHIWPRRTFMLIALPNTDGSFTGTLFIPRELFKSLSTPERVLEFFVSQFPDAVNLIGKEGLVEQFLEHPKSNLMSIKCSPYHYEDKAIIIGDAAHAMVPFYGQGMNCGMEDVTTLMNFISSEKDLGSAFNRYSQERSIDTAAICDLSIHNFYEMRHGVTRPGYKLKRFLESILYRFFPGMGVVPLYSMVSFTNIRYSEVIRRWKRQSFWMEGTLLSSVATAIGLGFLGLSIFTRRL